MKRWLICLGPWMAMTAAAGQDVPRQVEVLYTNVGPAEAWRVADECYVAPNILTSWHWQFTINGNEATIQAEGRTLKVPTRIVHDRVLFPAKAIFEQLGATCRWKTNDEMDVLGEVRMVTVKDGLLEIDSTISSKPHVFVLSNPQRLVIDMRGMTLGAAAQNNLPPNVAASQNEPDTVRVVYQSDDAPKRPVNSDDATRHFGYKLASGSGPVKLPEVAYDPDAEQGAQTNVAPPSNPPAVVGSSGMIEAQAPAVSSEDSRAATLTIPLSAVMPTSSRIRWRRVDLFTFEMTLPGVHFSGPVGKPASPSFEDIRLKQLGDAAVLRIKTDKPMGLELTNSENFVQLVFHKPTGDGHLQGRTIVIDAGHGGKDSGAQSPDRTVMEKSLTLAIALRLANDLAAAGATVLMTRTTDVFIPLPDRPALGNNNNADLFISIHINSNMVAESRSGTTTYYHAHLQESEALAECVEHEIAKVSGIPMLGVASDLTRFRSGMIVLRASKMPAVLIETGYINCALDRARMSDPEFQSSVAQAIVKGVKVFFSNAKQEAAQ